MNSFAMWKNVVSFELHVCRGWSLVYGKLPNQRMHITEGSKFGRLSKDMSGVEVRPNKHFLSEKPLIVINDDPHKNMLNFLGITQDLTCSDGVGYIPKSLADNSIKQDLYSDEDDDLTFQGNPCDSCMFLGNLNKVLNVNRCDLKIKPEIPECLYKVSTDSIEDLGWMFTVGVRSVDFSQFHSDEGYYELPMVELPGGFVFFGSQNDLNWIELDSDRYPKDLRDLDLVTIEAKLADGLYERTLPKKYKTFTGSTGVYCGGFVDSGWWKISSEQTDFPSKQTGGGGGQDKISQYFCCGPVGEDSLGNTFKFPNGFARWINTTCSDPKRVFIPEGAQFSQWNGNFKVVTKEKTIYRMYTDFSKIEYCAHEFRDFSEYDEGEKNMKNLEKAIKKAESQSFNLEGELVYYNLS